MKDKELKKYIKRMRKVHIDSVVETLNSNVSLVEKLGVLKQSLRAPYYRKILADARVDQWLDDNARTIISLDDILFE